MPLVFFWSVLTCTGLVSALPCMNTSFFTPFSTYDTNRRLVLTSLASNVPAHRGFYNASIGQSPNKVYATGMCIPGTEPEVCSACIMSGSYALIENCLIHKEASFWQSNRTHCMIRYSHTSFIGSLELEPSIEVSNPMDLRMTATDFSRAWKGLTLRMGQAISSNKDTTWSGGRYYAADVAALPDSQTLYGLMQCTPDLSKADCNLCLQESVNFYQQFFLGQQGGIIMRLSCFLRTELFKILLQDTRLNPTSPSQVSPYEAMTMIIINMKRFIVIIIILGLIARRFSVLCWRKKSNQEIDFDQSRITSIHSLQFDFKTIEAATDKFAMSNKLGHGGFGQVYKGTLPNGTEIAVKRLSKTSSQGAQEFKNEVVVVAKLQHRNLVRLLGYCREGAEKNLVYEFVANKSVDYFRFDPTKKKQKNSSFHQTSDATAENFAWKLWKNRSPLELVDPNIVENYQIEEVTRCIHIALLCVQEDPTDRPNLSTITLMLTSNTLILPVPQPPGFFLQNRRNQKQGLEELESSQSTIRSYSQSINDITITDLDPR
ncbi:unnamed protein product [Brassica rapa subsp. trilocularis]